MTRFGLTSRSTPRPAWTCGRARQSTDFLRPVLLFVFLGLLLGSFISCKESKKKSQESSTSPPKKNRADQEQHPPHAWSFDTPKKALESLKDSIEKIELDKIINFIDPRANMKMEKLRLLAITQGGWRPTNPSAVIFEKINTPREDNVIEEMSAKTDERELHIKISERTKLITRVARTLLTSSASRPQDCKIEILKKKPVSKLFDMQEWSVPAKRVGKTLVEPWDKAAFGRLVCFQRRPSVVLLREKTTKRWVFAQLDDSLPRRYSWKYEKPPEKNPFKNPGKPPATHEKLFSSALDCLKRKDAECIGKLVDLELFSAHKVTEILVMLSSEARKKLSQNLEFIDLANRELASVYLWRHLVLWTRYLDLDWSKCEVRRKGTDESKMIKKRYTLTWEEESLPKPTSELLNKLVQLRSILYSCPKGIQLHLTGARTKHRKGWALMDIGLTEEKHFSNNLNQEIKIQDKKGDQNEPR